jgi:hypothetical protein
MHVLSQAIHLDKPRATFHMVFQCEELSEGRRILDTDMGEVANKYWSSMVEKQYTAEEMVWAMWTVITDFLYSTKQQRRVQCTEISCEPQDGMLYRFIPTETTGAMENG